MTLIELANKINKAVDAGYGKNTVVVDTDSCIHIADVEDAYMLTEDDFNNDEINCGIAEECGMNKFVIRFSV